MKLSQAIREGRQHVQGQSFTSWFVWDARRPRWQIDKYPPNVACAVGMGLRGVGWKPLNAWTQEDAAVAAEVRWNKTPIRMAIELNDIHKMRWDQIAAQLEKAGY